MVTLYGLLLLKSKFYDIPNKSARESACQQLNYLSVQCNAHSIGQNTKTPASNGVSVQRPSVDKKASTILD